MKTDLGEILEVVGWCLVILLMVAWVIVGVFA